MGLSRLRIMNASGLHAVLPLLATLTLGLVMGCAAETEPGAGEPAESLGSTSQAMTLETSIDRAGTYGERCQNVVTTMRSLQLVKAPIVLDPFQGASWTKQDALFASHASRCSDWMSRASRAGAAKTSFAAKLADFAALDEEYEEMADDMAGSTRSFLVVSNASKTRHDIAIGTIDNLK